MLSEVESRAREILELGEMLENQFNSIAQKLVNIYNIVNKTNSPQSRKLKELIDKYDKNINELREYYGQSASEIITYTNATNENLLQLKENLRVTLKIYNDMLSSIEL